MIEAIATYFAQNGADWLQMVAEHLAISATALLAACALALPLGVACSASALTERLAGGVAGVFRVIPSLAVLILCVPVLGVGTPPAVAALTVLAIPPILINTAVAFRSVPAAVIEAALGMGMNRAQLFCIQSNARSPFPWRSPACAPPPPRSSPPPPLPPTSAREDWAC